MAKSFKTLKNTMTPAARRAAEAKTEEMILALPLTELRQARKLSQAQFARRRLAWSLTPGRRGRLSSRFGHWLLCVQHAIPRFWEHQATGEN